MEFWFITDETPYFIDEGLSLVGIFSTKDNALNYLRDTVLGSEIFDTIKWEQSLHNNNYYEGLRPNGARYILSTTEVDNP